VVTFNRNVLLDICKMVVCIHLQINFVTDLAGMYVHWMCFIYISGQEHFQLVSEDLETVV
jgi:hypothetical protein